MRRLSVRDQGRERAESSALVLSTGEPIAPVLVIEKLGYPTAA
jgi:hypothetical protein